MRLRGAATALAVLSLAAAGCGGVKDKAPDAGAEPGAGSWRTWVLPSAGAVRVPPPPAGASVAGKADQRALQRGGRNLTAAQRRRIAFWSQRPAVKPWIDVALEYVSQRPKDPPAASRAYALVSVAMHDAVIDAYHWKYRYRRKASAGGAPGPDPSYPSEHAAMAAAASRVLAYAFPEHPAARLERMARAAAAARLEAGTSTPSDVAAGMNLGRAVGDAVVSRARRDGFSRRWNGRRPHGRAYWDPPPGSVARPVEPVAGKSRTWVLASGRAVRPGPPPKYGSPEFVRQARQLVDLKAHLTPKQRRAAIFWAGGQGTSLPAGIWNQVMLQYLANRPMSLPRLTRLFALLNVAQADAGVAAWDAKYTYWSPRPENAIRDLKIARGWKPLIKTPFFPSYVSGHAAYSGAAAEVLSYLFPDDAKLFHDKAREAAMSRLWGGIHYLSDSTVGLRMGREVGRQVVRRAERDGSGQ